MVGKGDWADTLLMRGKSATQTWIAKNTTTTLGEGSPMLMRGKSMTATASLQLL